MTTDQEVFDAGVAAGRAMESYNPYKEDDYRRELWQAGYRRGCTLKVRFPLFIGAIFGLGAVAVSLYCIGALFSGGCHSATNTAIRGVEWLGR